jgi:hypothetical protein
MAYNKVYTRSFQMKRDTLKTLAGLIIIVGIVVATFMYGNSQRQKQLAEEQKAKQQQETAAQQQAKSVSPSTTPTPNASAVKPTPTKAPVAAPGKPTATPKAGSGGTVAGTTTTPVTGGTGTSLPDTGPEAVGMVGLSAIGVMALAVRRSRRAMVEAARSRR